MKHKMTIQVARLAALLLICCHSIVRADDFCPIDGHASDSGCRDDHEDASINTEASQSDERCFRAAVYEHSRVRASDCLKMAEANLVIFRKVAGIAAKQGANIIVFPEDGLFMGSKREIEIALTEIPNPDTLDASNNNPCLHPAFYHESPIMRNLSCIARDSSLYLVANFGTKEYCEPQSIVGDQKCPDSGYFKLNTNVVFDSRGNFIKRYRKFNTFIEVFDKAPYLETTYFDTPYGRFGTFTCFDILFKSPAVELVEKFHVDTVLFPTWWYDELPLLSAIQFQEAWSSSNNVNLLGANIHERDLGSVSSGIFSGNNSIYSSSSASTPKLIIASLPKKSSDSTASCSTDPKAIIIDVETNVPEKSYAHKNFTLLATDVTFTLEKTRQKHTVCSGQVCCTIDYEIDTQYSAKLSNRVVLIVRNHLRPGYFEWYEQICALVTLESPINTKQIGETRYSVEGLLKFKKLSLKGTFETEYVYPTTAHDVTRLVDKKSRQVHCRGIGLKLTSCKMELTGDFDKTINAFGLYGRKYESDNMPY